VFAISVSVLLLVHSASAWFKDTRYRKGMFGKSMDPHHAVLKNFVATPALCFFIIFLFRQVTGTTFFA
jgi:hypothetical protein